ncbi:hypothetical protein ILUMI_00003 [Ignelater luminosus]|uniref:Uncharacterized protein n=1 Tax=Ignelater luminosus TaxID=2038154 RepID=A0A8K0GIU5_IGNLU|nr:hypothetical protein ILUMI_00003 [Ignelater luminosus]
MEAAKKDQEKYIPDKIQKSATMSKFHQYFYGCEFTLTDNKPLQAILNPEKSLPMITALRLTCYALFLRQYNNYNIQHRPGNCHQNVDYFSRASIPTSKQEEIDETYLVVHESMINQATISQVMTIKIIAEETTKDKNLSQLR